MAEARQRLYRELHDTDFSCILDGKYHLRDIYQMVKDSYPEACDDSILCKDTCQQGDNSPEWCHRVRTALGFRKGKGRIEKKEADGRGYWRFGSSAVQTRNYFTDGEIVLCTYAAMFNENDFGGLSRITSLRERSVGSLRMKRNNIVSMLDEEGIDRETTFQGLTGLTSGKGGRRTNWEIVEPLLNLSKSDFLSLCLNILDGNEFTLHSLNEGGYVEGAMRIVNSKRYERNRDAREACIAHYGAKCNVPGCGFDFEEEYGELGIGFIHVHHVKPISEQNSEYVVDPINDLIPVCPNCHSMIHRGNTTRDWKHIRNLVGD